MIVLVLIWAAALGAAAWAAGTAAAMRDRFTTALSITAALALLALPMTGVLT